MAIYNLSCLFQSQVVAHSAAAPLVFATPGAPVAVPAPYNYQLAVIRVTNITASPVSLTVWRVSAAAATPANSNIVGPVTVMVPPGVQTFQALDVTPLWGAVLMSGDAIWMLAGTANALNVTGDGLVIQP